MRKSKKDKWREALCLPEMGSDEEVNFSNKSGTLLAQGYLRVVIGGRGPYVEFEEGNIIKSSFGIPQDQMWRFDSDICYYYEYRSKDESYVKLYRQRKLVKYADYKVGFFYMSPYELTSDKFPILIGELE